MVMISPKSSVMGAAEISLQISSRVPKASARSLLWKYIMSSFMALMPRKVSSFVKRASVLAATIIPRSLWL